MATARSSNLKRTEWNRKCREKLSAHIQSRLGILVDPSQVRLKPNLDDPYTWERMEEKEHLFLKNISDHSNKSLMELYEGIGVSFAAVGKDSIRELQAGAVQSKYLCSPKTEVSFTTKINELQEREARLTCELNKWRNQAAIELDMRCQAEGKVNHLEVVIQEARNDNQKLEQHIQEWKLVAEQSQSNVFKYRDGNYSTGTSPVIEMPALALVLSMILVLARELALACISSQTSSGNSSC
ncbi:hypothetical protein F5882DRAFT_475205 [Hyaloscypha sp. PMI_1271]|nr:hypothetical protein F5882DRAFT_475205 [Hyaloscypha sp. PMI_1271]